jgi:polyisoprenoid-binding protein YceI
MAAVRLLWVWICGCLLCLHSAVIGAAPQHFAFDRVHSRISFKVDHLGFSQSTGWFPQFDGQLWFDQDNWSASSVNVQVVVAALQMGDQKWNRKMLGRSFFRANKFSTMHFVSQRVEQLDARRGRIHGELTLLGQTRSLVLDFVFNRRARHKYTLRDTVGFSATAVLKRSDFGMKAMLGDVGDEVQIELQIEAQRARPPRAPAGPQDVRP